MTRMAMNISVWRTHRVSRNSALLLDPRSLPGATATLQIPMSIFTLVTANRVSNLHGAMHLPSNHSCTDIHATKSEWDNYNVQA